MNATTQFQSINRWELLNLYFSVEVAVPVYAVWYTKVIEEWCQMKRDDKLKTQQTFNLWLHPPFRWLNFSRLEWQYQKRNALTQRTVLYFSTNVHGSRGEMLQQPFHLNPNPEREVILLENMVCHLPSMLLFSFHLHAMERRELQCSNEKSKSLCYCWRRESAKIPSTPSATNETSSQFFFRKLRQEFQIK